MSWKDYLRPASFRGVEFYIDTSKKSLGRRAVQHEYPNRDEASSEDMGRIAEGFEIEGHVLGDDYFQAKALLEEAFNKRGPGELIHPYYGSKFVQCSVVDFQESTREGAILVFSVKFLESAETVFPKGINDKSAILSSSIDTALVKSKEDFDNNFSIDDLPGFAVDTAREAISTAQKTFDEVTKKYSDQADKIAKLAFSTRNLAAEANDLLQAPSELSSRLLDSFSLMEDAISNFKLKTLAHEDFFFFTGSTSTIDAVTPVREKEKKNADAFNNFMRRAASVKSAQTAVFSEYVTFEEAAEKRDSIIAVLEEQLKIDEGTEVFQAIMDVKSQLTEALPDTDSDLPSAKEVTLSDTTPSLNLVYDLFEEPDNEQDIIDRNNVRHPGFIEPNKALEVVDG